jgi:hypothetical protein
VCSSFCVVIDTYYTEAILVELLNLVKLDFEVVGEHGLILRDVLEETSRTWKDRTGLVLLVLIAGIFAETSVPTFWAIG